MYITEFIIYMHINAHHNGRMYIIISHPKPGRGCHSDSRVVVRVVPYCTTTRSTRSTRSTR